MERMKIRNPKIKKWRGLLILALIGAIIAVAMEIYLSDHALTPDQISKKGQYCAVTSRWMSDAFATETMNGEDTYDYFLVLSEDSDRFFMIRSWTDDEQCLKYIDSLYESGEYEKIDQEWTGGSQPVDDEVKNYAIQYVSEYMGMNLTTDMYDDYFYSYCMDLTSMGDMDTVIGGMLLMFALLLIGLLGCLISAIRWHGRIAALKRQDFFPKFEQNWMQSGEKMDTKHRQVVVVKDFLLVPSYKDIVIPLDQVVWCYVLPLAKKNYGLYIMGTDGKAVLVCRVKEKGSVYVREYLEQIHLSAPWMAIGYSAENRQAFGAYEKSETIAKIIAKKDKMMSQFPF